MRKFTLLFSALCVFFSFSFRKASDKKTYGIIAVIKCYPKSDRTTIMLADLSKLDAENYDTYEYLVSYGSFGNVADLDIQNDFTDEQNRKDPSGKWKEKISFDIASVGSDKLLFDSKRTLRDYMFSYMED